MGRVRREAAQLQHQIDTLIEELRVAHKREKELRGELSNERLMRVSAQRGLVPYVQSLESFHAWLLRHPDLARQVEPTMLDLGIWNIKLGYDPDHDLRLSAVTAGLPQSRT